MHFAKSVQAERIVTEREAQQLEAQSREHFTDHNYHYELFISFLPQWL